MHASLSFLSTPQICSRNRSHYCPSNIITSCINLKSSYAIESVSGSACKTIIEFKTSFESSNFVDVMNGRGMIMKSAFASKMLVK